MRHYLVVLAALVATVAISSRLAECAAMELAAAEPTRALARAGAERGPEWRVSRVMGEYSGRVGDRSASVMLLADGSRDWVAAWSLATRLREGHAWPAGLRVGGVPAANRPEAPWPGGAGEAAERARAVTLLRRGLAHAGAGRAAPAVAAFEQVATELPWLADWANYLAAEALAPTGDTAEVRRRLERAGPELAQGRGLRFHVEAARHAGDLTLARRLVLDAARSTQSASDRAAAWVVLGGFRLAAGDTAGAREAYRSAMAASPGSLAGVDAARGLSRVGPTPGEWRMIASIYLRHGNQARARAGFEAFLASGTGTPEERGTARVQIGRALFAAGRYVEAERHLLQLASDPVPERVAAEALYLAGRAQQRRGQVAEAKRTWRRLAKRFPSQDGAARGLFMLGHHQHEDLDLAAARTSYRRAVSIAPALEESGLALMRLGGLHYLAGDHAEAAAAFEAYRRLHPYGPHLAQADFWTARSYLAMGREVDGRAVLRELRVRDPISYYGIRAAQLLDEPVLAIALEASPPRRERTDSLARRAVVRVDVLTDLNRRVERGLEVERLRARFAGEDGGDYALAEALNERGYTLLALSVGWDIVRREGAWNPRLLRIIHPFPYQALVTTEALGQGVDPYLAAAVIRRESAFNPGVTSSAGAIGLMQIMPATGRGLARDVGLTNYRTEMLMEPELNVHLGVRYLGGLLQQFDEQLHLVLSAYNAGPARARRWRQFPEQREPELFMERIPFHETREYVRHVMLYQALYRELYPGLDRFAAAAGD